MSETGFGLGVDPMQPRRSSQKPRELRRRVVVPARLRHGAAWTDACILNVSTRGLMIHTGRQISTGTQVEVRRGDHVIIARVVWRDGGRAGLFAEDRVPVEEIMTLGQSPTLQLTAGPAERRRNPRPQERSRLQGRAMEFAAVVAIGAFLAVAGLSMVQSAFARPLAMVSAALGN
jgi:PilZ domain-containing protein